MNPFPIPKHPDQILQLELKTVMDKYPKGHAGPRMHPIIPYVAEECDLASTKHRDIDLDALRLSDVAEDCAAVKENHPTWNPALYTLQLDQWIWTVNAADYWWLPPLILRGGVEGEYLALP